MNTRRIAVAFAFMVVFVVAVMVVPVDEASAADTKVISVEYNTDEGNIIIVTVDSVPSENLVLSVYDVDQNPLRTSAGVPYSVILPASNFTAYNGAYITFADPAGTGIAINSTDKFVYVIIGSESENVYFAQAVGPDAVVDDGGDFDGDSTMLIIAAVIVIVVVILIAVLLYRKKQGQGN